MTPIEFIFLGLICGGAILLLLCAFAYTIWLLRGLKQSTDSLTKTIQISVEQMGAARFVGTLNMIANELPGMVAGVKGLAAVMGIFNKAVTNREATTAAGGVALRGMEEESGFVPYNEEAMAENERIDRARRETGIDIRESERRLDQMFKPQIDKDRGFFPSPGGPPVLADLVPNGGPEKFVPPPAHVEIDGVPQMTPTPEKS